MREGSHLAASGRVPPHVVESHSAPRLFISAFHFSENAHLSAHFLKIKKKKQLEGKNIWIIM